MSRTRRKKLDWYSFEDEPWRESADKKKWFKPNSSYKKMARRKRKTQQKRALLRGESPAREPKEDVWNWN
jgi:hypothetical protein